MASGRDSFRTMVWKLKSTKDPRTGVVTQFWEHEVRKLHPRTRVKLPSVERVQCSLDGVSHILRAAMDHHPGNGLKIIFIPWEDEPEKGLTE